MKTLIFVLCLLPICAFAQSADEVFMQGLLQGLRQGSSNQWLFPSLEQQQIQKQNRYLDELTMQQQLMNIQRRMEISQPSRIIVPDRVIPLQGARKPTNCINVGVSLVCN